MTKNEIERRLDRAMSQTHALTNALEGRTVGHKPLCVATAQMVQELEAIVTELADEIDVLRSKVERQTEGHD